jgi:glycosyltransferase involved in cell wall biosynthesis
MKLLYCIPALYHAGGMERVLTLKANFLASQQNYDITIVTTDQQKKPIYFPLDKKIRLIHLPIDFDAHYDAPILKKYILHNRKLKKYKKELTQLVQEYEIDVCISLCGKEIEFLYKLPVKCKKIAEMHFSMNFRKQFLVARHKGFIWEIIGTIRTNQLKKSVARLDRVVVLTKADQQQWELTHKNIIHIPNPNPLQNQSVSQLNSKRVITIGKLDAQKGYDRLIEAWSLVKAKHPDWRLDIYGVGEWKEMLQNRIIELHLQNQVILHGLTNDVVSKYLESSFYVMSSRYEGFPMVLIEAMSCGLPVVSFDCEYGPGELITNGIDGFLIEQDNIEKLAEAIGVLIDNEKLRIQMGVSAIQKSMLYSVEKIMHQWELLFEHLFH